MPISPVAPQLPDAPPSLDLTGKARIRHAALQLFASKGYAQASLRRIAQRASVSLALIGHHFGSKLLLREAVDRWVVRRLGEAALASVDLRAPLSVAATQLARAYQASLDAEPDMRAYLRRTVLEDMRGEAQVLSLALEQIRQILGQVPEAMRGGSADPLAPWATQVFVQVFGQLVLEPALRRDVGRRAGGESSASAIDESAESSRPFAAGARLPRHAEAAAAPLGLVNAY